ncbi:MAG: valyl-tRNA synthetase, partial [Methanolobus sp.]|nr:valyl-tRNA synthetase [Methanolobus sp.]
MTIPKEYDPHIIEPKWRDSWDMSMYHFDWKDNTRPQFIIDTPPPYPTGNFHIGNSLNWCYIDFVARYKRMCGFNVMFPQGWDCHGLPTEVKVEEIHGITKNEVPREEFRNMCRELTVGNIEKMRQTMLNLGFSTDWSNEFVTMEPEYYSKTQRSFRQMYDMDRLYQSEHPVNWCPRCETAIAFAEVEYDARETKLNFLHFDGLEIATTRPELLAACVAVVINPEDERYKQHIGSTVKVPLFGHEVKVIGDEAVDPSFGTGVVMICTFGDKQDVRWWLEHGLPLRKAIDKQGFMTDIAGKYKGMTIPECKQAIIEDLKSEGYLYEQKSLDQNVGMCWRCSTPIEILSERQWFIKIPNEEIAMAANEIEWLPEYMKVRLDNWN